MASGGSAPAAPDPVATANAQSAANVEAAKATAALNRYDTITPFGSSTWSQDPNNSEKWSNTTTLDPQVQTMLNSYYDKANQPMPSLDMSKLPAAGVAAQIKALDLSGAPAIGATKIDAGTAMSGKNAQAYSELALSQADRLKKLYSTEFNYDSLGDMPTASDDTRRAVEDAYYKRSTARLDPRFQQDENALRARLGNQGISEGSQAYTTELDNFNRGKNDAYSSATNDAVTNSTSEMAKQFAMQMDARQQGAAELEKARALPTAEAQAAMGLYGGASGINNQNLTTQNNIYQSDLAASRAARDSYVSEQQMAHANAVADQNQQFNQANAARATALQEQVTNANLSDAQRSQVLNELMALRSGSQVQGSGSTQTTVGAAPVAQSIYNNYQGAQNAHNADVATANSTNTTIGTLGAAAMTALEVF